MEYNFCVLSENKIRVDMYLSALFKDFSRSYVQKLIDLGYLKLNGTILNKNKKIQNKDEILLSVQKEKLEGINPENIKIDIIYEDENILILNKDSGINVHPVPGENGKTNTLVNAILYHCKNNLPIINGVERPGIVHRLDKDTSGIIMIAKNDKMMHYLSDIIKERKIEKYYIAIVNGIIKEKKFKIESYIGRDPNNRQKMTSKNPINPKIAISYGEVLEYINNKFTKLLVKIETGRTHQIRVHLSSIGYPIVGDKVYGNPKINKHFSTLFQLKRQALHAYSLELELYGKKQKFIAHLKKDMLRIIGMNREKFKLH